MSTPGVPGLLRITSGDNGLPLVGSAPFCADGSTSSTRLFWKTSPGRCVTSVFAMIIFANELFSSSVMKLRPAVRSK
ncbi:hypothetical protein D3C73_555710 [compost metagenome]